MVLVSPGCFSTTPYRFVTSFLVNNNFLEELEKGRQPKDICKHGEVGFSSRKNVLIIDSRRPVPPLNISSHRLTFCVKLYEWSLRDLKGFIPTSTGPVMASLRKEPRRNQRGLDDTSSRCHVGVMRLSYLNRAHR
jgi:hypothetical protein